MPRGAASILDPFRFPERHQYSQSRVINPTGSVKYIVTVRDVLGCPAVRDTVIVRVISIKADAGPSDTSVVLGQSLQLGASGGTQYLWTPSTWLNNPNIHNPISLPQNNITYQVRVSDDNGCVGYDNINVHVFFVQPGFYVPTAFSPNGDGKNDIFRPILIGMKSMDVFRVYNRWGQLLYSGSGNEGNGWDGTFGGRPQDAATYVWYAEGTDYLNKTVKKKGYGADPVSSTQDLSILSITILLSKEKITGYLNNNPLTGLRFA
ncbi:MAG: gliding motility-associated C-terminal domain-containing protein [Chitinophagaceae bacterium]|nr:gliding motility-associated C-terminal domain-containing protein [Chitinophagaceae bacterium]